MTTLIPSQKLISILYFEKNGKNLKKVKAKFILNFAIYSLMSAVETLWTNNQPSSGMVPKDDGGTSSIVGSRKE